MDKSAYVLVAPIVNKPVSVLVFAYNIKRLEFFFSFIADIPLQILESQASDNAFRTRLYVGDIGIEFFQIQLFGEFCNLFSYQFVTGCDYRSTDSLLIILLEENLRVSFYQRVSNNVFYAEDMP